MKDEEKFLNRFVNTLEWPESIKKPFYREGFVYATNRTIMVRVPYNDLKRVYEPAESPKNLPQFPESTCDIELPISVLVETFKSIPQCEERRVEGKAAECDECEGSGEVEWTYEDSDGEEHQKYFDCPICNGDGKVKTKKFYREWLYTSINGVPFRNNELIIMAEAAHDLGLDSIKILHLPKSCSPARFQLEPNIDIIIMAAVDVKVDREISLVENGNNP